MRQEISGQNTEDYLNNWIRGDRKGGVFKDNAEVSSLADLMYNDAKSQEKRKIEGGIGFG